MKIKNNKKVEAVFKESHVIILLEDMRDDIKLIAEGVSGLREEMDRRFEEVNKKFEQIDRRFEQIDRRFEQIDRRFEQIDRRFEQSDANFKAIFKYQSGFSDEVHGRFNQIDKRFDQLDSELAEIKEELKKIDKNKVDVKRFNLLEKRVIKLERKLEGYNKIVVRRKKQAKSKAGK